MMSKLIFIFTAISLLTGIDSFAASVNGGPYAAGTCLGFYQHTYKKEADGNPADPSSFSEVDKITTVQDSSYTFYQIFQKAPQLTNTNKRIVNNTTANITQFNKRKAYVIDCAYFDSLAGITSTTLQTN